MNNGAAPPTPPFNTKSMLNLTEDFLIFFLLCHLSGLCSTVVDFCNLFLSYIPSFLIIYSHGNCKCVSLTLIQRLSKTNNFYTRLTNKLSVCRFIRAGFGEDKISDTATSKTLSSNRNADISLSETFRPTQLSLFSDSYFGLYYKMQKNPNRTY